MILATLCSAVLPTLFFPIAQTPVQVETHFQVPAQGTSVPLFHWGSRPVVEVHSGETVLRLILDTGSSAALSLAESVPVVRELRLGDAVWENPSVRRIRFALPNQNSADRIDGILGLPAFGEILLTMDFGAKKLELAQETLAAEMKGVLPWRRDGGLDGLPTITLTAGGIELEAHLDTGSPEILLVSHEIAERLPLAREPRPVGIAQTPMGDAQISEVELVGPIEFGPIRIEPALLRVADLPQIVGRNLGNVGARLFGNARLSMDLANRRLLVELPDETADEHLGGEEQPKSDKG